MSAPVYKPCYYTEGGECITCPANAYQPPTPAVWSTSASPVWNAGANSIDTVDGDLHLTFSVSELPAGVVCGIRYARLNPTIPNLIDYHFHVYTLNGAPAFIVGELAAQRTGPVAYTLGNTLEIRRVGGFVSYYNDGNFVYASTVRSAGPMVTTGCLLVAGDSIS